MALTKETIITSTLNRSSLSGSNLIGSYLLIGSNHLDPFSRPPN